MNIEPAYAALFALLEASADFATASRRLRHWSDVSPPDQPALFSVQGNPTVATQPGLDPVWTLRADLYVYANTQGADGVAPGQLMNPLLQAITEALAPDNVMTNKCTLGGLVEHCWIEGQIETDEGALGDQGVLIIPVAMLVTGY